MMGQSKNQNKRRRYNLFLNYRSIYLSLKHNNKSIQLIVFSILQIRLVSTLNRRSFPHATNSIDTIEIQGILLLGDRFLPAMHYWKNTLRNLGL
jgi:hypothetical protein